MSTKYQDDKDFTAKYQLALVRVGLGIHIIEQVFIQHGAPTPYTQILEDKSSCIRAWAAVLANGLDMSIDTVVDDALKTYKNFHMSFLNSRDTQVTMQSMIRNMSRAGAIPRF